MSVRSDTIHWQDSNNGVTIDCGLEICVHPTSNSKTILLLVPGVDGSVDGYDNKYVTIAESIHKKHGAAIVRIDNPFISSFHWESNIRRILDYIESNKTEICGNQSYELRIQAHSAGASIVATIAHEYSTISSLLLINIAMGLNTNGIIENIEHFQGNVTILMGDQDPSVETVKQISFSDSSSQGQIVIAPNTDHNFSGESFQVFLNAADNYLFKGLS
ncbi:MAG: hypothetical protein M3Q79_04250 [bacterium]|nr:hypothetical protein [bacterium]